MMRWCIGPIHKVKEPLIKFAALLRSLESPALSRRNARRPYSAHVFPLKAFIISSWQKNAIMLCWKSTDCFFVWCLRMPRWRAIFPTVDLTRSESRHAIGSFWYLQAAVRLTGSNYFFAMALGKRTVTQMLRSCQNSQKTTVDRS